MSDYRTTTGEPLPEGGRQRRRLRRQWVRRALWITGIALLAGLVIPVRIRVPARGYVTTDRYAEVRPAVAGPVAEILVSSGQPVRAGDLMVRLDDRDARAALAEASNAVRRVDARLVRRTAELADAHRLHQHQVREAQLRLDHASAALNMTGELHTQGLASGRALEDQKMALALAKAGLERLRDRDESLAEKELEELRREQDVLRSVVSRAEAGLYARRIYAPIAGDPVRYEFVIGELVTPDHVLYEIFGGSRRILKLRIPERYAGQVAPGNAYEAILKMYSGLGRRRFRGSILELRAVIESDHQEHYRMATCSFDAGGMDIPPGTSAEVRVTVSRVPFWFWVLGIR